MSRAGCGSPGESQNPHNICIETSAWTLRRTSSRAKRKPPPVVDRSADPGPTRIVFAVEAVPRNELPAGESLRSGAGGELLGTSSAMVQHSEAFETNLRLSAAPVRNRLEGPRVSA